MFVSNAHHYPPFSIGIVEVEERDLSTAYPQPGGKVTI